MPDAMGGRERLGYLHAVIERLRDASAGPFSSRWASVSPSRNCITRIGVPLVLADVVKRTDVRMFEPRDVPGLALEPFAPERMGGQGSPAAS